MQEQGIQQQYLAVPQLQAKVIWETTLPIGIEPTIFRSGAYEGVTAQGQSVYFDWEEQESKVYLLPNGHVHLEANHRDFDFDFCLEHTCLQIELCEDELELEMQFASILSNLTLATAVVDVTFQVDGHNIPVRMKLKEMTLFGADATHSYDVSKVDVEQLGGCLYAAV